MRAIIASVICDGSPSNGLSRSSTSGGRQPKKSRRSLRCLSAEDNRAQVPHSERRVRTDNPARRQSVALRAAGYAAAVSFRHEPWLILVELWTAAGVHGIRL